MRTDRSAPAGELSDGTRSGAGVLLAAGGFEGNETMRRDHDVPGDTAWTMAPRRHQHRGADPGRGRARRRHRLPPASSWPSSWPRAARRRRLCSPCGFRSGLMVDQGGRRYANECLPYDRFGREMAKAPERIPSWYVFDSREDGRLPAIAMPEGDPAAHLAAGTWVSAATIGELAAAAGLPQDALAETVERFNGYAAAGVDEEFHRGEDEYDTFFTGGQGPNGALSPCDTPPYFAARFVLSDLGTKGGLVTDAAGRVLRADGTPIAGLYAAGNTAASVFGSVYPGPGARWGRPWSSPRVRWRTSQR